MDSLFLQHKLIHLGNSCIYMVFSSTTFKCFLDPEEMQSFHYLGTYGYSKFKLIWHMGSLASYASPSILVEYTERI